jgi:hypothetical protein
MCRVLCAVQVQGAAEKIKRETDVHLRQLAKISAYVPTFFFLKCVFGRFSASGVQKRHKNMFIKSACRKIFALFFNCL